MTNSCQLLSDIIFAKGGKSIMKKRYDINKIYEKLISDKIPDAYVAFLVKKNLEERQKEAEQKRENAEVLRYYPRLYGKL